MEKLKNVTINYGSNNTISFFEDTISIQIKNLKRLDSFLKNNFVKVINYTIEENNFFNDLNDEQNERIIDNSYLEHYLEVFKTTPPTHECFENPIITILKEDIKRDVEEVNELFDNVRLNLEYLTDEEVLEFLSLNTLNENVKLIYTYNRNANVSSSELKSTIERTLSITNEIKKYNLSPLEQLMLVYDMVRKYEYTYETPEEGIDKSRDLSKVYTGDKIVCAGYANMFSAICENLGITAEYYTYINKEKKRGHASNIIFVNDSKYDVHSVFEVDTTWASRKGNNDYLQNYSTFAMPTEFAENKKKGKDLYPTFKWDKSITDKIERNKKIKILGAPETILIGNAKIVLKAIQDMAVRIGAQNIIDSCEDAMNSNSTMYENQYELFKNQFKKNNSYLRLLGINIPDSYLFLSTETFLKVLYNTRRIEYSINSEIYNLDINEIISITNKLYNSKISLDTALKILNTSIEDLQADKELIDSNRLQKTLKKDIK